MVDSQIAATHYMGTRLDALLASHGITRNSKEDDWALRQRAFPTVFLEDQQVALEMLLGGPESIWTGTQRIAVRKLREKLEELPPDRPPPEELLRRFAESFTEDPVVWRELCDEICSFVD